MLKPSTRFLAREHAGLIEIAHRCLDVLACVMASLGISFIANVPSNLRQDWGLLVLVQLFLVMLIFQQHDLYRSWRGRPYSDQFGRLLLAWTLVCLLLWIVWLVMGLEMVIDGTFFILWLTLGLTVILTQRALFHLGVRRFRKQGLNSKHVMIYGAGTLGQSISNQIKRSPESGYQVAAYIDDDPTLQGKSLGGIKILGGLVSLDEILRQNPVDELWIALPLSATKKVASVLEISNLHAVSVRLFPDIYGLTLLNHSISELLGFPIIDLNVDRMQGINHLLKELEDKVLGSVFFVLALVPIGVIALLIKTTSGGPVLFKQRRVGWDGKPFTIYKFRTMLSHQEKVGVVTQATRDDPRLTLIGRWLRRTSLDELPQLFNVLQGRMSLVGPRPHAMEHDHLYQQQIEGYMRRNRVKPGITGWAQINDLRGEIQSLDDMVRRVKHDLFYIEHWSLWFDLRILIATALKVFFSKKAW